MGNSFLDSKIEFLKGVGPQRGDTLKTELQIFTFRDLIQFYPFRYVDKTKFHEIRSIGPDSYAVQLKGVLRRLESVGSGRKRRLVGRFRDHTGVIELIWFKGVSYLEKNLMIGATYIVYGKPTLFSGRLNMTHPEMDIATPGNTQQSLSLEPVYHSTGKLEGRGLDSRGIMKLQKVLRNKLAKERIPEILPDYFVKKFKFTDRRKALADIHFPASQNDLTIASNRLKFEELFFLQLKLLAQKTKRKLAIKGHVFASVGDHFNTFYKNHLKFELTGAQKRVVKEIRQDLGRGAQMNRLLQGDVGSGKTIVSLLCMLIGLDNGFQACMMAPTEILAQQHYSSLREQVSGLGIQIGFLSGSVKGKKRKQLLELLKEGELDIVIGTHALIEDWVVFKNLGLAVIDEQHRFGVAQRASLWKKGIGAPPHVLVMTATPIPRTLAMTLYGDLDVSVIDELPPGRKDVLTLHKTENGRLRVFGMMKEEIAKGRQVYIVYPLIEESEAEQFAELNNLMEGYESISREFPKPQYQVSIVHGRMKAKEKDFEMQRFVKGETQIMIATTVIEVGVNVPNATMMVIENTERFGLSQLHQLRGRVGRGGEQSYCILMSSFKLTKEGRKRIETMCRTNNGFEIAEVDMELRGPGNIQGTQQSGIIDFKIANLATDSRILQTAREIAMRVLEDDPQLEKPHHARLRQYLERDKTFRSNWSRIS